MGNTATMYVGEWANEVEREAEEDGSTVEQSSTVDDMGGGWAVELSDEDTNDVVLDVKIYNSIFNLHHQCELRESLDGTVEHTSTTIRTPNSTPNSDSAAQQTGSGSL
uniref:Uncharacterized protein n=1 Tax=Lygus hesperus TaxID=30085 RepID=A0A0A9YQJ2_LYGHE